MAFTLQQVVNKKRVYLANDFHVYHKDEPLHGEMITFADSVIFTPTLEGTSNQNDAITFKSFAAAKEYKKKFKLTNWDIQFIANPIVSVKTEKVRVKKQEMAIIKASALPAFHL